MIDPHEMMDRATCTIPGAVAVMSLTLETGSVDWIQWKPPSNRNPGVVEIVAASGYLLPRSSQSEQTQRQGRSP